MILYLAGLQMMKKYLDSGDIDPAGVNCLSSYVEVTPSSAKYIPKFRNFMLDSGAFTFLSSGKDHKIDWYEYADKYAAYVSRNQIGLYFELDIDKIVGLKIVEELRRRIERTVGWPSIQVWHPTRDKEYYLNMVKTCPYVAFGGFLTDRIHNQHLQRYVPWFIATAHRHGCKIHGLGYTVTTNFKNFRFDSVDSTSWMAARRYGKGYKFFKEGYMRLYSSHESGQVRIRRLIDEKAQELTNLREWLKMSDYCLIHL